eukprot:6633564-Lingulodinium_polyedra.AAC.1
MSGRGSPSSRRSSWPAWRLGPPSHGFHAEDFAEPFLSGEYDGQIHETSNPTLAGKFWPWIKAR